MDSSTLNAFRRRDANAVRALYREYGHLVYAVAHRALGRHDLAEEAVQHTFVSAWRAVDELPPETLDAVWHVRRAIEALPPEEATIVRLQHLEGMTTARSPRSSASHWEP